MSIDRGHGRVDEGRRSRRTRERLTPAGKPGQAGEPLAQSPSQKSVVQSKPMERSVSRGAKEKVKETLRGMSPLPVWLRRLGYYGLALLFVVAAAMLRSALGDVLSPAPILVFYLAWVGATAFGGLGPGLLATAASWLCIDFLFDPTPGQIGFADPMSIARVLVLLAGGLVVSLVGEKMRRTRIRERRQGRELASANGVLRESEERLRRRAEEVETLMDLIPVAIWVAHDPQCNHITGNEAADRFYEAYRQENVSANVSPVRRFFRDGQELQPEEPPMQVAAAQDIDIRDSEADVLLPSGTWRNMLGSARPLHDAEGRVRGCIGVFMDITARKQAEQALHERMKELACLYAVSRDVQEDSSMEELCRRAVEHLVPAMRFPEITVSVIELAGKRFTSGNYAEGLSHGLHAQIRVEGEVLGYLRVYYAEERPFIIPEEQNLVNGVAEAFSTWLERKRAEEALRESEERYHRLFEDDLTGDFISTREGRILLCNPAFAEMFGFSSAQEAVATSILDLYFDAGEREPLLERLKQEGRIGRLEVWRKRRDGNPIYVVENLVGHFNDRGELYEIKGYLSDDTERKRVDEALRELTATLERKVAQRTAEVKHRIRQLQKLTLDMSEAEDRERRRLAEILHDDLQQVLAAAKFHLNLMKHRVRHDASLQATAAQIDHMLKDAIEKSRSLSHELSPAVMHHADFSETLRWLANEVQAKHGLVVHVHAHGEVYSQSDALKAFLYRTAQELLFNVVKHARVQEAQIRVRRLGRCICLSVSDHGRGFDPQELGQTAGFGLLSIRERIELLGGRMTIKSAEGKGSTFRIVVPDSEPVAAPPPSGVKTTRPEKAGLPAEGRLRVLLADDYEIVREDLLSLLSEEHTVEVVTEAANGREAVDLAGRLKPDVVIMDVSLPLIGGDEATRQIKAHLPKTRVIALSMYNEPETMERMYQAGAESYVLKTAPSEELLAAIRSKDSDA